MKFCFLNAYHDLNVNQFQFFPKKQAIGARLFDGAKALYSEGRKRRHTVYCAENASALTTADVIIFLDWDHQNPLCHLAMSLEKPKAFVQCELSSHLQLPKLGNEILLFSYSEDYSYRKVYPFNYSVNLSERPKSENFERNKFITMIATNYKKSFPGELYSLRESIAQHAQKYFRDKFYLYGRNWNLLGLESNGFIDNKDQILAQSIFSICLEKSYLANGYVTEKLLETIFYGAIPIYYCTGHSRRKIPRDVFINLADFESPDALFRYITKMSQNQINDLRSRGSIWMSSENFSIFDSNYNSLSFWDTLEKKLHIKTQ